MATLENLPADQRAVLQLVLQRGRGYDEIARLLSMDRAAVRERALNAFDALGPQTGVGDQRRALITDYLLGQLPPIVTRDVRDHLAESPSERAWARVLASELAPLTNRPLPEIPTEAVRNSAPMAAPAAIEPAAFPAEEKKKRESVLLRRRRDKPTAVEPAKPAADEKKKRESVLLRRRDNKRAAKEAAAGTAAGGVAEQIAAATGAAPPRKDDVKPAARGDGDGERRSSRAGGAILLAVGVLIAIAVVAFIVGNSGNSKPHAAASTSATTGAPAAASGTTTSSTSAAHVVAQVNLKSTTKGGKAAGIAEILKEGTSDGIAIVAQNVPPNATKPPNAYAVWLYNATNDAHFLGFVNPGVGTNGKLSTAGGLPTNASHYKQLIVTVETVSHPKAPGTIILSGPLTGL
jgi:hypothetical protein